jgi:RNA polymerase sigma-70 factor (ECF subfamily)
LDEKAAQTPAVGNSAEERERRVERLYAALATLSDADRSIALLYLDQLSYREIAEVLGITESNVGVRLNRVKKRLIERLQKENQ